MLAVVRIILVTILIFVISLFSITLCMVRPKNKNNAHVTAIFMGKLGKIFGIEVEIRKPKGYKEECPVVYVANHQNSYDIFTISACLPKRTVTIGKKSLRWIPFFGQMYWFTGNILIDRANRSKAHNTISTAAQKMRDKNLSVWLFPEGTRSYGRGLLPFKTGAFHTAKQAGVPIVPICVSNSHDMVKLNRWNNGKMIVEFLDPIEIEDDSNTSIRHIANSTHELMLAKINEISDEAGNPFTVSDSKKAG
ncbi:1-acylglycerol-3-phosphate O-acyltransferase [Thalassomonas sp. M1454]|uniref:1-acylglycerol-3-phosphate O-acyltransferase n=1 Tax=Thalassomonas sp. M1454 TaxID=2594477 RepID=UPI00117E9466|nr:1-acylglycerol-3-phosphate O-acyltransferase [Thalassomonas sp. M1454]TRX53876.1 1-acylglycerol-3-phosphate O-acyltransferase [Thalassomonas sp. M1454]